MIKQLFCDVCVTAETGTQLKQIQEQLNIRHDFTHQFLYIYIISNSADEQHMTLWFKINIFVLLIYLVFFLYNWKQTNALIILL